MSTVKSSHDAVYTCPAPVSSRNEGNLEKNDGTFDDDFSGLDTFGDLTSTPFPMFLIQSVSPPSPSRARSLSPSRRCNSKYHPISMNFVSHIAEGSQGHRKVSSQAISPQGAQKETCIMKSNKVKKPTLGTMQERIRKPQAINHLLSKERVLSTT
ncbi:uncharacterized protein LOC113851529 [Abrus precatorius]|uniref:Uncharacterized protein LOC113851529 n=1 Tax=Abrus precatorius TaxID=3816 RepID=A0A8B8K448_ABRPR|nr:uncharacterized protein LOC113851529 [Abrus precatorius]